jgi:creatinine amidohydrolase
VDYLLPTATTAEEKQRKAQVAVLPIGSFEQTRELSSANHRHVIAVTISKEIASAYPVLQLPPVTISCSHEHSSWPGTVSISASTLSAIVKDVANSTNRAGLSALILVNGHGGNYVLSNVVQEANAHGVRMALFPSGQDWKDARKAAQLESTTHEDMHAGELETSIILYAQPELVRDGYETADWLSNDRRHLLIEGMTAYTASGVIGRPSLGSADKGKAVLASLVRGCADVLRALHVKPDDAT